MNKNLLVALVMILPTITVALDFKISTNNNEIVINGYIGDKGAITIPETINGLPVTTIGNYVCSANPNLETISLPTSIKKVGDGALHACPNLTAIYVDSGNEAYSSRDGVLFNEDGTILIQYPGGKSGIYSVPVSTLFIKVGAFGFSKKLEGIIIPKSVTKIGRSAFSTCTNLSYFDVSPGSTSFTSEDGVLFNKDKTTLIQYPVAKADTTYSIPDSVTLISNSAFNPCKNLTEITVPASVATIDRSAFDHCSNLKSVYFRGNAPKVYGRIFLSKNDTIIYYEEHSHGWSSFDQCSTQALTKN